MVTDYLILETTFRWKWAPASRPPPHPEQDARVLVQRWARGSPAGAEAHCSWAYVPTGVLWVPSRS